MNKDSTKSKSNCSICSRINKDRVELSCGEFVYKEQQQNKIKCQTCRQQFEVVKENEFELKHFAKKFLNKKLDLKQKLEESIQLFYQMCDEFTLNRNGLDLDCYDHFQEMRFQLDQHREELKEKIDDIYMQMIDKTKEFEAKYSKSFNVIIESSFNFKSANDELKEIEKMIQSSNLSIESIQEMQHKQDDAIETLRLTLYEMDKVKEHLKKSNLFKSKSSFDKEAFGQLFLNEYPWTPFPESQILQGQHLLELIYLCEFDLKDKFTLLYRGSRDGFRADDFHSKCDLKTNTLTLVKASETSYIFGGFTTASWDNSNTFKSDSNAFLFSLTNKENKPCKMKIDPNRHQYAIFCGSECGPIFGGCYCDICIVSNANTKTCSSNLGSTYPHPQHTFGTNEAKSFLAGSFEFQLSEIEVYQKE